MNSANSKSLQGIELTKSQKIIETETARQIILDSLPFDVWLKDLDGRYIAVNQSFVKYTGSGSFPFSFLLTLYSYSIQSFSAVHFSSFPTSKYFMSGQNLESVGGRVSSSSGVSELRVKAVSPIR